MALGIRSRLAGRVVVAIALAAVLAPAMAVEVTRVTLGSGEEGVVLQIRAQGSVQYEVRSLTDPPRGVIELPGADLSRTRLPEVPRRGVVKDLRLRSGTGEGDGPPRVAVLLERPREPVVEETDDGLRVRFRAREGEADEPSGPPALRHCRFRSSRKGQVRLGLVTGGRVPRFKAFQLHDPRRLVVDLFGVADALEQQTGEAEVPLVERWEAGAQGRRLRLVLHLAAPVSHAVERTEGGLAVRLERAGSAAKAGPLRVEGADFTVGPEASTGRLELALSRSGGKVSLRREKNRVVLDMPGARLAEGLEKRMVVTDFGTVVDHIDLYQKGEKVRAVVRGEGPLHPRTYQLEDRLVLDVARREGGDKRGAQAVGEPYEGERLSLNFQQIEVRHALDILAGFADLNIVAAQGVGGRLTLRLTEVPWDQALDLILESQNLGMEREGKVIRVAPRSRLQKQRRAELEAEQRRRQLVPLTTELIRVSYAQAADLRSLLRGEASGGGEQGPSPAKGLPPLEPKGGGGAPERGQGLLSARGSISVDERTNTLIVRDTPDQIREIERLVDRLDRPTRQVRIEARIVKVDTSFGRDLGIQWGGKYDSSGGVNDANIAGGDIGPRDLAVNLPAAGLTGGEPASLGMRLGRIADNATLDLQLSAIEQEGEGRIISSPRVITADQGKATIEQGTEIPYQQATSSGATSVAFKKAVLSLEVTPQITPDNRVRLAVNAHNDSRGEDTVAGPAIDTEEVTTQVLVDNGETVVIGGIYATSRRRDAARVPVLGRIPLLGWLFAGQSTSREKSELLIFLTPRILEERTPALEEASG